MIRNGFRPREGYTRTARTHPDTSPYSKYRYQLVQRIGPVIAQPVPHNDQILRKSAQHIGLGPETQPVVIHTAKFTALTYEPVTTRRASTAWMRRAPR